jgi:hypothetical protein
MKAALLEILDNKKRIIEGVQEYTSDSGKTVITFKEQADNNSVKITTKLYVDFNLNDLPETYQENFIELSELLELQWADLIKKWYEGDLEEAEEEVEETEAEIAELE